MSFDNNERTGKPMYKYREVDINENDIPAKEEQKSKVHGFRSKMSTAGGKKVLASRKSKRKKQLSA